MTRHSFLFLALFSAVSLGAQSPDTTARATTPPARKTVITLNPFALFATYFAGDIERTVTPTLTVGAGASYTGTRDFNEYGALEGKMRYYPQEKPLQGFSVAGTVGISTYKPDNLVYAYDANGTPIYPNGSGADRRTRPTVGTELSYQWLLGPKRRFVTVVGLGVKRLLGTEEYSDPFSSNVIPTARINIGIAF